MHNKSLLYWIIEIEKLWWQINFDALCFLKYRFFFIIILFILHTHLCMRNVLKLKYVRSEFWIFTRQKQTILAWQHWRQESTRTQGDLLIFCE
jgi:hypothetical protein